MKSFRKCHAPSQMFSLNRDPLNAKHIDESKIADSVLLSVFTNSNVNYNRVQVVLKRILFHALLKTGTVTTFKLYFMAVEVESPFNRKHSYHGRRDDVARQKPSVI